MVADVPLGAFLSGGIDSSLIVALMQEQCSKALETFTIGFSDDNFNEAHYARKISDHLKTSHNELYISPRDVLDVIPKIPNICDEPLADQSIVPTYLLCALARKKVTVSISGYGADEFFGGY
jgi:asparagine synthase (glutamine-hydrolysing)